MSKLLYLLTSLLFLAACNECGSENPLGVDWSRLNNFDPKVKNELGSFPLLMPPPIVESGDLNKDEPVVSVGNDDVPSGGTLTGGGKGKDLVQELNDFCLRSGFGGQFSFELIGSDKDFNQRKNDPNAIGFYGSLDSNGNWANGRIALVISGKNATSDELNKLFLGLKDSNLLDGYNFNATLFNSSNPSDTGRLSGEGNLPLNFTGSGEDSGASSGKIVIEIKIDQPPAPEEEEPSEEQPKPKRDYVSYYKEISEEFWYGQDAKQSFGKDLNDLRITLDQMSKNPKLLVRKTNLNVADPSPNVPLERLFCAVPKPAHGFMVYIAGVHAKTQKDAKYLVVTDDEDKLKELLSNEDRQAIYRFQVPVGFPIIYIGEGNYLLPKILSNRSDFYGRIVWPRISLDYDFGTEDAFVAGYDNEYIGIEARYCKDIEFPVQSLGSH